MVIVKSVGTTTYAVEMATENTSKRRGKKAPKALACSPSTDYWIHFLEFTRAIAQTELEIQAKKAQKNRKEHEQYLELLKKFAQFSGAGVNSLIRTP